MMIIVVVMLFAWCLFFSAVWPWLHQYMQHRSHDKSVMKQRVQESIGVVPDDVIMLNDDAVGASPCTVERLALGDDPKHTTTAAKRMIGRYYALAAEKLVAEGTHEHGAAYMYEHAAKHYRASGDRVESMTMSLQAGRYYVLAAKASAAGGDHGFATSCYKRAVQCYAAGGDLQSTVAVSKLVGEQIAKVAEKCVSSSLDGAASTTAATLLAKEQHVLIAKQHAANGHHDQSADHYERAARCYEMDGDAIHAMAMNVLAGDQCVLAACQLAAQGFLEGADFFYQNAIECYEAGRDGQKVAHVCALKRDARACASTALDATEQPGQTCRSAADERRII